MSESPPPIPGLEFDRELGRGAHSVVFAASRGSRACAVKVALRGTRYGRWFRREAAALARVKHPGVPRVLEIGDHDGRPYLAMELIDGETLSSRFARGMSEEDVLQLGLALSDIAASIHDCGLVHRDIKPKNVLISKDGEIRLVDFGLATPSFPLADSRAAGTKHYAAPEQVDTPHLVDGRTDLYAIGRVLEQAGALRGDRRLASIVHSLLEPQMADRYASARALRRDLERVAGGGDPLGPRGNDGPEPPRQTRLIGREDELGSLQSAWEATRRGKGAAVLVEGPPGAGKTRLLDELVRRVGSSARSVCLRAGGGSPAPLAVVRRLLDSYLELGEGGLGSPGWRARLLDAVPEAARGDLAAIVPRLAPIIETSPDAPASDSEALAENAAQTLVEIGRRVGALLIVVDDIQWLDPLSREVLVRVALTSASAPVMVVVAARSDARSLPPLQRFGRALGAKRLDVVSVRPLSQSQIAELVSAYLGTNDIDDSLVSRVAGLCDGTPLGALDIVGTFIDQGVLRPSWGRWAFDNRASHDLELPRGALTHLIGRVREMPPASVRVLRAAAVVGTTFERRVLARLVGISDADADLVLAEAARVGIVGPGREGVRRFVHDTIREALLADMTPQLLAQLHRRAAAVLAESDTNEPSQLFSIAAHLRAGVEFEDAPAAYALGYEAARQAAAITDHETAVACFELASDAAAKAGRELDLPFLLAFSASRMAVGAHEETLRTLEHALRLAEGVDRAAVLARIASVHGALGDPPRAWAALDRAFAVAGSKLPTERIGSAARTIADVGRLATRLTGGLATEPAERRRIEILCDLHYQNARLGVEGDKPLRLVHSSVAMMRAARRLGPSPRLVRAQSGFGAFSAVLGREAAGSRHIREAEANAREIGDPALIADAIKHSILLAYWSGDTRRAVEMTEELFADYGAWIDVGDYVQLASSARLSESARGAPRRAMTWLEASVDRVRRHGRVPRIFSAAVVPALEAVCSVLDDPFPVAQRLAGLEIAHAVEGAFVEMHRWGPRAHLLLSTGDFGAAFEELVTRFEAKSQHPRRAHLLVVEYYYCIAYIRAAQCEAADPADPELMRKLDAAICDLRKAARLDVFKTHLHALEGDQLRLRGNFNKARARLAKARDLADKELVPWVLYEVARCEARMLRAQGHEEAARERARVAAVHAHTYGAARRLAAVEQEFALEPLGGTTSSQPGSSRSSARSASHHNLQLSALVKVVNAAAQEQRLEPQAKTVLDELLKVVGVERGILLFERSEPESARLLTARTRSGEDWDPSTEGYPRLLKQVCDQGRPISPGDDAVLAESSGPFDTLRLIAAPLFVHSEVVGALILQRGPSEARFSNSDVELVAALAPQVPIALELARLLEERERLQETLRQAQKMEGVGQLASGIAHDFNNMLTAIMASVDAFGTASGLDEPQQQALEVVRDSTERARQLTSQLLSFSRRQVLDMKTLDVGIAVERVLPMLQRMLGGEVTVKLQRRSGAQFAETDRSSLENMIVNLAVNARDAMPDGGTLEIIVDDFDVDESIVAQGASRIGRHVRIRVRDTGSGMPPEVLVKVFEPFFTTKPVGSGTGLGLASAYGFIKQCGGHIDVESEVGRGTAFTILLPAAAPPPKTAAAQPLETVHTPTSALTVLVVEDEELVRLATKASLERAGYAVRFAEHGEDALTLLGAGEEVDAIITDVMMPTMDGPTFVQNLAAAGYLVPVLLVSGYADPSVLERLDSGAPVAFLAKPYTREELMTQLHELLARSRAAQ